MANRELILISSSVSVNHVDDNIKKRNFAQSAKQRHMEFRSYNNRAQKAEKNKTYFH